MSTKTCPSCGLEVPTVAKRCKSCFHDFEAPKKSSGMMGVLLLLGVLAAGSVMGAVTMYAITAVPLEERVLVDQESQSIVWTRHYRTGIQTERLAWGDVTKLQYIVHRNGDYELSAVTTDGSSKAVKIARAPLMNEATQYKDLMNKPLEEINKAGGLGSGGSLK